jgi:hypothetical protein
MGTRSRIAVMHGDKCKSVYCHWDGYLEHNGLILQEHYDSAKANHLVALGDLSSLRPNIPSVTLTLPQRVVSNTSWTTEIHARSTVATVEKKASNLQWI